MTRLLLSIGWLLVIGCATVITPPIDHSISKGLLLPFRVDSIYISDSREDSITTEMDIIFSARQQEWKITPALEPGLHTEIIDMIQSASNPEGFPTTLTLFITNGYYKISRNSNRMGEHTFFECTILYSIKSPEANWTTSGNSYSDHVGFFNVTEKSLKQSYRIAVRNAVYRALKEAEKVTEE
jgi:hypothetical protein